MLNRQPSILILLLLSLAISFPAKSQAPSRKLGFRTAQGWNITVEKGKILVNDKQLYRLEEASIMYESKRNRIIEDGGSSFLFLEINGETDSDRFYVFQLGKEKVERLVDVVSSDVKDFDGDSYLEFGGCNLTEVHPSEDSMYYIPFNYYEIRHGRISYDSALSKKMAIRENGVYLPYPDDQGIYGCCKVIVKPGLKKVSLVDPLIISERIDGPANLRDTIKGRLLFALNDNVPVITADEEAGWYHINLTVDLTEVQMATRKISRGTALLANGVIIGKSYDDLTVAEVHTKEGKRKGVLSGYTATRNIKAPTMPENVLARMIDAPSPENIGMTRLKDFIRGFGLSKIKIGSYETFQLHQKLVPGLPSKLRLALVFNGDELFAVVQRRKVRFTAAAEHKLSGSFSLSVIASPSLEYTSNFISQFNDWINIP